MRPSSASLRSWTRLIRFLGKDGKIYHGEPQGALTWPHLTSRSGGSAARLHNDTIVADLKAKVIVSSSASKDKTSPSSSSSSSSAATAEEATSLDIFSPESWTVTDKIVPVARLLSPLGHVPTFRCIGLNYAKHAEETKMPIPKFPILFMKPSMALQDPFADVVIPSIAENSQADFENELAVVIGKRCKNVKEEDALDYVLGYTVGNDISTRKWQGTTLGSGQWCFSKSFDTFAPLGPCLVSRDVIPNPNKLRIQTTLNGKPMQNSNTSDMIFHVPRLISFLSQSTTLMPGDVILTGTPEGVGFKREPPVFLQHGDHVVCEIENIGELHSPIVYESRKAKDSK